MYIIAGFAAALLMMYIWRFFKLRPLREIACAVLLAGVVLAFWLFFNDMFGYIAEHAGMEDTYLENAMTLIAVLCALLAACTVVFALRGMKDDTLRSLMKFVIAFIIMAAVANLLVHIIKEPAGRMRYRAMNSALGATMGGFGNFTEWYKMNGQPDASVLAAFEELYGVSDAFKSFPSGHTCAAGMTYALIMLPDILKMKNKPLRALCWIFPVLFTGLVAVSRIMVGAHYFSDVLFGGTIAFLSMMLAREIVVFNGIYGGLSEKNDPNLTPGLFLLPPGTMALGKMPYMEVGVGLENILQLFRVVYFYRLTYRDHDLNWLGKWGGLRFGIYLDF